MKKLLLLVLSLVLCLTTFTVVGCGESTPTVEVTVDASFSGENGATVNGVKTYKTIQSAIDSFGGASASSKKVINIKEGTYAEKISVPQELANLSMLGATDGTTKITFGDYAGMKNQSGGIIGTDKTATANVYAEGFIAKNIYFENSFDYFNPPAGVTDLQALAMYCRADKVIFENCIFTGYQDTLEVVEGRQYFKNCTIKGCVDFIFGNNPAVLFDNCDIVSVNRKNSNGGYITAMKGNNGTNGQQVATYGLVFKGCRLTAETGVIDASVALGRPWRADATVAWINCEMGAHIGKNALGKGKARYTYMEGGGQTNYPFIANFVEYGNTGVGSTTEKLLSTYTARENGVTVLHNATDPDFTLLTAEQAAAYIPENIFATTNGGVTYTGDWNPCK